MPSHKESPRHRGHGAGAGVRSGQDDHGKGTPQPARERFVPAAGWSVAQVETALATADARQLVAALDQAVGKRDTACHCPAPGCGGLRTVTALGRWHWTCERCGTLGSWLSLRQPVALSVEACRRLAELVHGRRAEVAA